MSKEEAIKNNRTVELLFSPKGPLLRDDKHLTGRSIFYFCCDGPYNFCREKQNAASLEDQAATEIPFLPSPGTTKSTPRRHSVRYRSQHRSAKSAKLKPASASSAVACFDRPPSALAHPSDAFASLPASPNDPVHALLDDCRPGSPLNNAWMQTPMNVTAVAFAACLPNPAKSHKSKARSLEKGKKRKPIEKKLPKPASERKTKTKGSDIEDLAMRKSVTFADDIKEDKSAKKETEEDAKKRRASLPPPPPQFLGEFEEARQRRRKRRESVAISFNDGQTSKPKKETVEERPRIVTKPVKEYEKPEWRTVKIIVTFKEAKYSTEFIEHKTLEDLYSWVRQELLKSDALTPGADLLLSHDNQKFPLKANTAKNTVGSLPHTEYFCEELQQGSRGGGFGDTNSRFDTRFGLPIDLRALEGVTPIQYMTKYCIVSKTWKAFYRNTFTQNDRDKDGKITYKELRNAMERLFVELAHPLLRRVLFLMGYDPAAAKHSQDQDMNFTITSSQNGWSEKPKLEPWHEKLSIEKETFVSVCALANRIICRENDIDGYPVDTIKQSGTQLEDADFYNIEGKLQECKLNPLTKRLLLYVNK